MSKNNKLQTGDAFNTINGEYTVDQCKHLNSGPLFKAKGAEDGRAKIHLWLSGTLTRKEALALVEFAFGQINLAKGEEPVAPKRRGAKETKPKKRKAKKAKAQKASKPSNKGLRKVYKRCIKMAEGGRWAAACMLARENDIPHEARGKGRARVIEEWKAARKGL